MSGPVLISRVGWVGTLLRLLPILIAVPAEATEPNPTFSRDVAPIVHRHCATCHRPAGAAPFSLLSYSEVRRRARQIVEVTQSRYMPPWLPAPGHGAFAGERRLSEAEIETLRRWSDAGSPRGRALAEAPLPAWPDGWQLGRPDLVVELAPSYELSAEGNDVFRNFVIAMPVAERRYVQAVELRPDNPRIVHHAVVMIDTTEASRREEALDPAPGFDGMGAYVNARSPDGHFLGWTPGKVPELSEPGLSWRLDPGTDLVLQLHLIRSGRPERVGARVGFYFTDEPPTRRLAVLRLGSKTIDIPAEERHYRIEDAFELPVEASVYGVYPHAHYLCSVMEAWAKLPNGSEVPLLKIPRWDLNWQDQYRYRVPVTLPAGSTIHMAYSYDNSMANDRNPNRPPRRVRYGPSSQDEMGDLWLQLLPRDRSDLAKLEAAAARREATSNVEGFRFAIDIDASNAEARLGLASALLHLGELRTAAAELRRVLETQPDRTAAHTNLGNALLALGQIGEAHLHLQRASELEPESAEVHYNLANSLLRLHRPEEALEHFDIAVTRDRNYAEAHLNRGLALSRLGRFADEEAAYKRALELRPGYVAAHFNLGHALDRQGRLHEALQSFERASSHDPSSPRVHYARAELLARLGEREAAAEAYRAVLAVDNDHTPARRGLELLEAQTLVEP